MTKELSYDLDFQKSLMATTFVHFLATKFQKDDDHFSELDDECNQLIREDFSG